MTHLDPFRNAKGEPMYVTSCARCERLVAAVSSEEYSQYCPDHQGGELSFMPAYIGDHELLAPEPGMSMANWLAASNHEIDAKLAEIKGGAA